jgi:hypothetical protein
MSVRMRATGEFLYHGNIAKPGDILIGSTSEYEWLRNNDCVVKVGMIEPEVKREMVDTKKTTERRGRR